MLAEIQLLPIHERSPGMTCADRFLPHYPFPLVQRLIEIIVLLCKSVGDDDFSLINKESADIFTRYAMILVSNGNLPTALRYLGGNDESKIVLLRHRICESLRNKLPRGIKAPTFPFKVKLLDLDNNCHDYEWFRLLPF